MEKVCKLCKSKVNRLIDGICIDCLVERAEKEQREALDLENETPNIQINEPLGDDFALVFSVGQGNFGPKAREKRLNTDILSEDNIREKLGISNSSTWNAVKPSVEYMVKKYEKQLRSGELHLMLLDQATMNYMATHSSNKEIIECKQCIAIYKD